MRAVPQYLAAAERQLAAGVTAHNVPDGACWSTSACTSAAADADYFANTLPQLAAAASPPAHREALLRELRTAGEAAAAAYRHLRDSVAEAFFSDAHGWGARHSRKPAAPTASRSARPSTTGRCATTCA